MPRATLTPIALALLSLSAPTFAAEDLANLVNEAALFAARGGKRLVDMEDFDRIVSVFMRFAAVIADWNRQWKVVFV